MKEAVSAITARQREVGNQGRDWSEGLGMDLGYTDSLDQLIWDSIRRMWWRMIATALAIVWRPDRSCEVDSEVNLAERSWFGRERRRSEEYSARSYDRLNHVQGSSPIASFWRIVIFHNILVGDPDDWRDTYSAVSQYNWKSIAWVTLIDSAGESTVQVDAIVSASNLEWQNSDMTTFKSVNLQTFAANLLRL